jgi:hypothetical protein
MVLHVDMTILGYQPMLRQGQIMCQPKADRHCGNSMTFPEYPKKNPKETGRW